MSRKISLSPEVLKRVNNKNKTYFEGWYFKHVAKDNRTHLVAIPGISINANDSHAFIQLITGEPFKPHYIRYDLDAFRYDADMDAIFIGPNRFSMKGVVLDIKSEGIELKAKITYHNISPIHSSFFSPNIMGFFSYFKFMQCNHDVLSMDHDLSGVLNINGKSYSLDKGKGYIEKDWGSSFPSEYIWLQCNHFDKDIKLFVSIAHIPFLGSSFLGFISVFTFRGEEYRFATYNGAKYTFKKLTDEKYEITLYRKQHRLVLSIKTANSMLLKSPKEGVMSGEIAETLQGKVKLTFFEGEELVVEAAGVNAGVEVVKFYTDKRS